MLDSIREFPWGSSLEFIQSVARHDDSGVTPPDLAGSGITSATSCDGCRPHWVIAWENDNLGI